MRWLLPLAALLAACPPALGGIATQAVLRAGLNRIQEANMTNISAAYIPAILKPILPFLRHLNMKEPKKLNPVQKDLACDGCIVAAEALIDLFLLGASLEDMEELAMTICILFNIEDRGVCRGAIDNYAPHLEYIFSQRRVHGNEICAILLGPPCGHWEEINSWTVELPDVEKPAIEVPAPPPPGSPTRKILHLSDVHLDLSYEIGAVAACDLPNCCMGSLGQADNPADAAQYWGDYRCDVPVWSFRRTLEHIRDNHYDEIDYIIITGDYPAHDVWLQSREGNLAHAQTALNLVKEIFPDKQVFPSMGNHEAFPCNIYPTSAVEGEYNPGYLYEELALLFADWLPESALETFRRDGFYSVNVGSDRKIIAINSNMCLTYNFYLFLSWQDPAGELAWLAEELLTAELEGRRVHILSHIPPGNGDCLGAWGREFTKIINRFESTVTGQFYGHTHNDEFAVFFDGDRATNIAFVTPSITTFTGLNPGYRLYTIDAGYEGATYRVLDHETFVFNLTAANLAGPDVEPEWYSLYAAKQDLEMESCFPEDWHQVVERLATEEEYYFKFLRFFNKNSKGELEIDEGPFSRGVLCPLVTTTNLDTSKCDSILG